MNYVKDIMVDKIMNVDWKFILEEQTRNDFSGVLYYDETNNFRKLLLNENGTNNEIENKSFVLGGLGKVDSKSVDCSSLLTVLQLDKGIKEIKFKHITHERNDFLSILKSEKLLKIFEWIHFDKSLIIHQCSINYFFYILIDIVDEVLHSDIGGYGIANHLQLKSMLYDATKLDIGYLLKQLYELGYPNINDDKVGIFATMIIDFLENRLYENLDVMDDFHTEYLRQLVKSMKKNKSIDFALDKTLFDSYALTFAQRIIPFSKAKLIFDREVSIEKELKNMNGIPNNYEFKDSQDDVAIQISDVIVGFISKLYSYVDYIEDEKLLLDISSMSKQQRKVLKLYFDIEDRTENICPYLLQHIQPFSARDKMGYLQQAVNLYDDY